MKTWSVHIPLLVKETEPAPGEKPKELALSIHFDVQAETAHEAALIVWERLSPTCGDP